MVRRRFGGRGTNVPHRKTTAALATEKMPLPGKITLLMQQHIGAPSKPVVQKGDTVQVGSLVGEAGGFVGANIYSGVSGAVVSVEKIVNTAGGMVDAVVIEPDGEQTVSPEVKPPEVNDRGSFLAAVRACGVVGLGGAGFPTAVKLAPKNLDDIDTVIINAAECEPYITSDNRVMLEAPEDVIDGIKAVQKYLGVQKAIIGIERNKPEAMDRMFELAKGEAGISVHPLATRYPQGAEKVLIERTTGREVPSTGLPADVGVIVLNVTTIAAIGQYLKTGMPLVSKRLTVDGGAVANPKNVEVLIGTPIKDIIEFCGGYKTPPAKLLLGGPMMGVALAGDDYPTTKQNNAVLAFSQQEAFLPEPQPCIRCGRCVNACPVGLSPVETGEAYEARDWDALDALSAGTCIMCGVCSFVCPAKRMVSQTAVLARGYYLKGVKR